MDTKEIHDREMVRLFDRFLEQEEADLWSLVLQSVDLQHEVRGVGSLWEIYTSDADAESARQQIADFTSENEGWPPPQAVPAPPAGGEVAPVLLMGAMILFYSITGPWSEHGRWFDAGAVSAEKITEAGEWWRLITGLTLHADPAHLMGNVFFGWLLLYFLAGQLGGGAAAVIALASGVLGNACNIFFRHGAHLSVGFSTSVFGMVGAFCGVRWFRLGFSFREMFLTMGAAFGLLALLGSGGGRTDLGAHFWGLAAGMLAGGLASLIRIDRYARATAIQALLHLFLVVMILISWYVCLSY